MSVELFATFGLILMKRLATCPPSKTQSTVSPPKTVATFSSTGRRIKVDCKRLAPITGGVAHSATGTVRGALGSRRCGSAKATLEVEGPKASPHATKMRIGGFTVSPFG